MPTIEILEGGRTGRRAMTLQDSQVHGRPTVTDQGPPPRSSEGKQRDGG